MILMTNAQCPCSKFMHQCHTLDHLAAAAGVTIIDSLEVIAAAFIRYLNAKKCKCASAKLVLFLISFTGMC
jgi:hypothetical protein